MLQSQPSQQFNEGILIYLPPEPFIMGTSDQQIDLLARADGLAKRWQQNGRFGREQPQHRVHLAGYWIGNFPVPVGEFRTFVQARDYSNERFWTESG